MHVEVMLAKLLNFCLICSLFLSWPANFLCKTSIETGSTKIRLPWVKFGHSEKKIETGSTKIRLPWVKFGHSEKNTKFEKIFHLKFDTMY